MAFGFVLQTELEPIRARLYGEMVEGMHMSEEFLGSDRETMIESLDFLETESVSRNSR